MANQNGSLTSGGGSATITASPNDTLTVTPTSGSFTLEYPLGTVLASGISATTTYPLTAGGQARLMCITGSVAYLLTDNPDAYALTQAQVVATQALVSGVGNPTANSADGVYFPKRLRRGSYGRLVCNWAALQNQAGTASLTAGPFPPFLDNATKVLRLDRNATNSFGQQNPIPGGQGYIPRGSSGTVPGFSAGLWVCNPGARTLNFRITFFNAAASFQLIYTGACDPTGLGNFTFLTFSPASQISGGWTHGTDAIAFVRVEQYDAGNEGAWVAGDYLFIGNVYIDLTTRPKFLLTFDDGVRDQRTPGTTSRVSGAAFVSSTLANTLNTAAAHGLLVGEPLRFSESAPTSLTLSTTYYVQTIPTTTSFTLATDAALASVAPTTGFSGTAKYQYGGAQDRSSQQVVESYGFRGTLFLVPLWLGTSGLYGTGNGNAYMSGADAKAMWLEGWSVGSHSNTHPFNAENAGLRLLGPYGYYLSNTFDNMSAAYRAIYAITTTTGRRRFTAGTQASPSVFTTENAHLFTQNQPIVFTDVAPTGCTLGITYYITGISGATCNLATDQGTLTATVNNTTGAWSGLANYRHPGSSPDDSAIFADVVAGANGVAALGIPTGYKFFALPQGGNDEFVRSAVSRAGIKWVRGIGSWNGVHTIPIGQPSGGGQTLQGPIPGGWINQTDALQTDGVETLAQIDAYVADTVTQSACGCNYHHALTPGSMVRLDRLCQNLRTRADAKQIEVLTLDEHARDLGI